MECHPLLQQKKLREYCDTKGKLNDIIVLRFQSSYQGILIQAYSPLGSPARWGVQASDHVAMEDPTIKEIAATKGATAAQVSQ